MFVDFNRLDSFYITSTQRNLYVSRLFLVSLVPWIDKPWGTTLREKLHETVRLRYINGLVGSMPLQLLEIGFHVEIHAIEWHDFQRETQFHGVVVA